MRIAILGGGIAGIAAGYFLAIKNIDFTIFETNDEIGGLCRSYTKSGFTFDLAGCHVLHPKSDEILELLLSFLGQNFVKSERMAKIRFQDRWITFPFSSSFQEL